MSVSSGIKPHGEQFWELIRRTCDGLATHAEEDLLARSLKASTLARTMYLDYLELHAELAWLHRDTSSKHLDEAAVLSLESPALHMPQTPRPARRSSPGSRRTQQISRHVSAPPRRLWLGAAAVVATILLGIFATLFLMRAGGQVVAARVEKVVDCRWNLANADSPAPRKGDALLSGQELDLIAGDVTLQFADGATTLVRAPARIEFLTASAARFDRGTLFANVPPQAVGFTVETPSARVVDLGTEFTVQVDDRQSTEVQVLKGRVESAHRRGDGAYSAPVVLVEGEALRTHQGGITERIAFAPPKMNSEVHVVEKPVEQKPPQQITTEKTSPEKKPLGYTVIAHYRLGEDDRPDEVGVTRPAVGALPLRKPGNTIYVSDTAWKESKRAISFSGKENEFFKIDSTLPRDLDNWFLEAWVRPRSIRDCRIVQNGDTGKEAFGFEMREGKWAGHFRQYGMRALDIQVKTGDWVHLSLVRQGTHIWLGINDKFSPTEIPANTSPLTLEGVFAIGGYPEEPAKTFDGEIDEVRYCKLDGPFEPSMLLKGDRAAGSD